MKRRLACPACGGAALQRGSVEVVDLLDLDEGDLFESVIVGPDLAALSRPVRMDCEGPPRVVAAFKCSACGRASALTIVGTAVEWGLK
jgi:hypothetical protein